jgi:hypothetical protein
MIAQSRFHRTQAVVIASVLLACGVASGAEKVVASAVAGDLVIDSTGLTVELQFDPSTEAVTGIGLTALWTAIVADKSDGIRPWSLDMSITATGPGGESLTWNDPIGGDRTIADYPFADFSGPQFSSPIDLSSGGAVSFFVDSGNPSPWVIGLNDAAFHLTTTVDDQIEVREGIADSEEQWSRPFFIEGVSGLGPVSFDVIEFTVPVSGGYTFDSIVASGNNFTYIYQGKFDPSQPLTNLLDYSLGNGFGPFGLPRGQSKIDALLFEGTTYLFVTSQWDRFSTAQPFTLTITGPALIEDAGSTPCPGDATGDLMVDLADLNLVLANFGADGTEGDVTGDGAVDLADLNLVLANFGTGC